MRQFWQQLQTRTRDWASKTYGSLPDITLTGRRVVNGVDAQHMLEHEVTFYFAAESSPGLAGIAIDTAGAVRNAATRMNQDVASITDASPLFLKLLAEQAGADLWREVSASLMQAGKGAASLTDPVGAAGRFDAANRYLQIEFQLRVEGENSHVWFFFPFDFMQEFARKSLRAAADQKAQARHHSQKTLSDSVRASTMTLDAVLERLSLTIGECAKLEIGAVLPLSGADAGKLSLTAETINGSVDIGSGELGVWKRQRALKLSTPIAVSFMQEIAES
jgi:flagellar motor switch/type III secretory pathway protein FliN